MTSKKYFVSMISLAAGLVVASVGGHALAYTQVTCKPTSVNVDWWSDITVLCDGQWYFAQPGTCSNTIATVKLYLSVIQSAILAGKTIQITNQLCDFHISKVVLNK